MSNPAPSTAPQQWDLLFTQPFTFLGEWNPATSYNFDSIVQYGGNSWIALAPSNNQLPDIGDYWDLFISRGGTGATGARGETGVTPNISIGIVENSTTAYVTSDNVDGNAILSFGIPKGDTGDAGFSPNRATINFSTGELNPGEATVINAEIVISAQILNLSTSYPARVRIYQDSGSAVADFGRSPGVFPFPDVVIFSEVITVYSKLSWGLYKPTFVFSRDETKVYPMTVTNNTDTAEDINISLDVFILIP
jgi:hypothetical protein